MPDTPPPKTTPPKTTKFRPRIATVDDPMIGAVADAFFRFESQKQAAEKLAHISKHYIRAKDQEPDSLRLWIRGFAVTPEEKSDGYRGHFARITIAAIDSGRFTLKAEKLIVELDRHPQKERPKERHPNWGHPIMRAVQTGKHFPSISVARCQLIELHEEFPDVTIPGKDKLHVMVYNRTLREGDNDNPIQKITLTITPLDDGSAKLVVKKPSARKKPATKQETAEPKGKFTTMLKQQTKRKPARKKPSEA